MWIYLLNLSFLVSTYLNGSGHDGVIQYSPSDSNGASGGPPSGHVNELQRDQQMETAV